MSDTIVASLITAGGALFLGLLILGRQAWQERKDARAAEIEERLNRADSLFDEYRDLLSEHRIKEDRLKADLTEARQETEAERADKRRIRAERDDWRRRAEGCERLWDQLSEAKERGRRET